MFVRSIRAEGFADLVEFEAGDLGRVVQVAGPSPASTALGDALELAFAALDPQGIRALLGRWGLLEPGEEPELIGDPLPEQARWRDRLAAQALSSSRKLGVTLDLALDPPLFGTLREQAASVPRLVTALGEGATVRLSVSLLFSQSYDTVAIHLPGLVVGDEVFNERDPWQQRFLFELRHRLLRYRAAPGLPARALQAATSRDQHGAYLRWQRALAQDGLAVRAARGPGDRPMLLVDERPLRRMGAGIAAHIHTLAAIHLDQPDVLWIESEDPRLDAIPEGEAPPLEQLWRVCAQGTLSPSQSTPRPGNSLAFKR